jgi:cation diffusion facilitator family transporter
MHIYSLSKWQHSHEFNVHDPMNEKRTINVIILTTGMMIFEILGGWIFGSMALLADGWHMGTHAAALGITLFAY